MSAPFRQLIGPAKSRLQRYTTEVDDLLLDNRPEDEDQHLFLRDARLLKTRLINVIALLSDQNNRWQQYIASLPEERQAAANQEYSDFDTGEDAFTIVLDHGREALDTIQAAIDDETSQTATEQLLQNITATIPNRHTPTNRTASLLSEDLGPLPQNPTYSVPQPNQTNEGLFQSPPNYNRGLFQPTHERSGGLFQLPTNEGDNLFQLPPIKMLRFNGNRADWASFWDMFNVGVHSRMMSRIEKYTRLLSLLYGEAEQFIKGYPYSADAYPLVIEALKKRYGQTDILAENLQAELLNMLPAQDNTDSLRKTSEAIDRICRQMKLLGHSEEQPVLHTAIKAKFPRSVITKVVEKQLISTTSPTVTQLREDISHVIAVREEVQRTLNVLKPEQPKRDEPRRPELKRATRSTEQARAFSVTEKKNGKPASKTVSTTQQKDGKPPKCFLCDKGLHWARECLVYTTPDDRCKKFAEQSRCFRCCRRGHNANACRKNSTCQNCQGKHHIILCPKLDRKEVRVTNSVTGERDLTRATVNQCLTNLPESEVLLMATDVKVSSPTNPGKQLAAFVFFDNGSQPSFIRTDYAEKLGLRKLTNGELEIHHFNADEPQRFRSPKYGLHIHQEDGTIRKVIVNGTKKICFGLRPTTFSPELKSKLPAKLYAVLSSSNKEPDLLIGMRDFWQFIDKVERITPGLTIVHTTVGPMICGETQGQLSPQREVVTSNMAISASNREHMPNVDQNVDFWSLQTIGIMDEPTEKDDEVAMDLFKKTVKKVNGRYCVQWPWKQPIPELPTNYQLCFSRLRSVLRRLQNSPELLQQYSSVIQDQLSKGILEDTGRNEGLEHFLPHQPVIRLDKSTTRVRIVYDASAKLRGKPSLNDCLYQGPTLLPSLAGLLLRFRNDRLALIFDVEKAFLMIELEEEDRNVCKFLWLKDITKPPTPSNLRILRFKRVTFGVNASPFLLNSTVQHHLDLEATESVDDSARHLAAELKHNMYVDDGTLGAESEEEALFKCSQSKLIFQRAGMNLRGYLVNSDAVMSQIHEEDRSNNDNPKFLGIPWNSQLDELTIKFPTQSTAVVPTRRSVLAELASTFDPLGLVSPAILPAKIFFQTLWTKDHSWDSPLNDEESSTWTQLQHNWHDQRITVQRRAGYDQDWELHVFVDASKDAYAATVYLRSHNEDASTAHLIFSKNRLKPKDGVTIPRLELLAILIGTRALKFVRRELHRPIKRQVLWSDSQCALRWIASTDDNSKFVTNRLREIRLTDCEFRFVPTALNPADLSTRGCSVQELKTHPLWWSGPDWLVGPDSNWPQQLSVMPPPDTSETFEDEPTSSTVMAITVQEPVPKLFNAERFSSWNTLVRTAMTAMRFLKHRVNIDANSALMQKRKWLSITSEGPFTAEDYKLATLILLQLHQREKSISDHETANLKFFKDEDGLIRLRSRMGNADWTEDSIHPILLWKDTHLVRLLIRQIHEQNHHIGVNATLTEFLAKYWTRHARKNVRKALSECMQCRRMLAKPYSLPPMPDHPKQRVRASQIWENIGLDYLGPTLMKKDGRLEKAWIMLVTCLSTRAVHLDVMVSLDTTTFINGFRRFVARRGKPRWVLSDNATGFKAAAACIAAAWQETLSQTQKDPYFTEHEIYWKFIPELAPWFGSTYERLVAIAKDAFRKTVGKNVLTFDELHTFVSEVEASMNHRPLTYVTTDADGILPLRPIDFIQPKALVLLEGPLLDESKDTEYRPVTFSRDRATEAWKATLAYQAKFWERWSEEYLQMLRERSQWTHRAPRLENSTSPKVGEVVLLHDNLRPKNLWKMGRITEVFETPNGIRTAKVLMGKDSILTRPVNKLYSLEVSDYSAREVEQPLAPDPPEPADPAPDPTEPADPTDDTAPRYQLRVNPKKKTLFTAPVLTTLIPLLLLLPYCSGLYAMPPRNPICSECSAQCTNRGLAVSIPAYVDKFEVCCDQTDCESHLYKPLTVIDLPHSQLVNSYSCTIHSWTPDSRSFQPLYLRCPAQDECKLLDCYLCWEALGNPSCLPGMAIWAIALLLTSFGCCVAGLFRHCCLNIDFCCGWLFRGTWHLLHGLLIGLSRRLRHLSPADKAKLRSSHTRDRRSYRSLARGRVTLCIVTLCLLSTEPVLGTTYTHSLSTREEACIQNGKEKTCYVNAVTQLSLLPAGQTTTMVLTDQNMRAIGSIALVVETMRMTCTPKNVLITRSYKVRTEAVKRCPRQGSCVDDYCSKVNLKTQIEELKEWNHLPGNTYCTDSCSFWWCRCGLPTPACLFYRVFAEPASASVYEVIKCSSWEYQVLVSLTLKTDTNSTSTLISLTPGMTSRWGNISLTPTSVSQAPVPVLGSYFLTDGTRTAMLDKVHTDLHCSDVATAANFSCQLSPTACAGCQVAEDTISCQCRDLRLEDFMEDPSIRLPLRVSGYQIRENNSKVFAETHRAAIQLTVKIDKVKLTTVYDGSTCRLTPQQLTGCYSCDSGGELKFKCATDHGRALANIKCEQGQWFTALCSQNEEEQTTLLSFTKAVINESCKVECPGGSSSFLLSGTLSYVPHRLSQPFNSIQGKDDPEAPSGGTCFLGFCIELDIWSYLMLLTNWQNCLWLILCVFVALIALWIYLKLNPAFRIWKMVARTYLTGLLLTSTLATPFDSQQNLATSLGIRPNQMTQKWGYISSELYLHPITRPMALNESPLIDFEISRYESPSHDTLKSTFSCSGSNRSNSKSDGELSEPSKKLKLAEPAKAVLRSLLHRRPPLKFSAGVSRTATLTKQKNFQQNII